MLPLPAGIRYERAEFIKARVNIDYHIEVRGHYYSVPYPLRGELVEARLSARMLEVLHRNKRVASHPRDDRKGRHSTLSEHMPRTHQAYLAWTPSRIIEWAGKIGPDCAKAVEDLLHQKEHPEQAYRAALGIIRLVKGYSEARVNAACRRALFFNICRYQHIKAILKNGKDLEPLPQTGTTTGASSHHHHNVRGAGYYAQN